MLGKPHQLRDDAAFSSYDQPILLTGVGKGNGAHRSHT
jgi:hypothetical protein